MGSEGREMKSDIKMSRRRQDICSIDMATAIPCKPLQMLRMANARLQKDFTDPIIPSPSSNYEYVLRSDRSINSSSFEDGFLKHGS